MIHYARGLWGLDEPVEVACARLAAAGFTAVESYIGDDEAAVAALAQAAAAQGLVWIAQIHSRRDGQADGVERLERHYRMAKSHGAVLVNLHTGGDIQPDVANNTLINSAEKLANSTALPCVHETHRGRCTYSIPATTRLLEQFPNMRFCADLSHWCCVHETLLERSPDVVNQVLQRSDLIHARVGHAQGPQVAHWRDPHTAHELAVHLAWWDQAVEAARVAQRDIILCPEFGPAPYQPRLPFTNQPVSDGWEVNLSMMLMLRERYGVA